MAETPFRVVLADDEALSRMLLRLLLESPGTFEVVAEATGGEGAVEAARREQPDLVLLDLAMPGMDGYGAIAGVLEAAPRARVAVVSGQSDRATRERVLALGAFELFEKATDIEGFALRLEAALRDR